MGDNLFVPVAAKWLASETDDDDDDVCVCVSASVCMPVLMSLHQSACLCVSLCLSLSIPLCLSAMVTLTLSFGSCDPRKVHICGDTRIARTHRNRTRCTPLDAARQYPG